MLSDDVVVGFKSVVAISKCDVTYAMKHINTKNVVLNYSNSEEMHQFYFEKIKSSNRE